MNVTVDKAPTEVTTEARGLRVSLGPLPALRSARFVWMVPIVLVALAAALFFVNQRHDADRTAAEQARKVVTLHVEQLLTYDYRYLDQQLAAQKGWLTGDFRTKYADLLTSQVAPAAKRSRLTTDASVVASGIVSVAHHEVHLLVFLDVSSQRAGQARPVQSGSRIAVTAQYVDGSWRISAMDPV